MQSHGTPAIIARGLEKRYPGGVTALAGLSFSVEAGTVFGLLGPNGAGKSTTVKVLTTLTRPDEGEAVVAGIDVLRDPERVRHVIGTVGQAIAVDPDASGRENLELAGRIHGLGGASLRQRVNELLAHFGLTDAAGRMARTYSGGMRRKLDVAAGLIHRPQILFLDEPTTGLDPEARSELWAEIGRLTREEGLTILLTTHYLDEADRLASQLAIVDRGRVVAGGSPEELKAELRGDAIVVELSDGADRRAVDAIASVPGIGESLVDGRSLRARAERGAATVPAVLSALEGAGIGVASVTVSRPSLDDVYLRHTGRAFRQTEESFA
ncbi:MAG TPA: ATP-binding cassette domain-containing protein [Candidatus Limnocylindria bacterium]|nr:ATP-binding cassette domain-containing protein [Candidatus Limnocylindria bacterium]